VACTGAWTFLGLGGHAPPGPPTSWTFVDAADLDDLAESNWSRIDGYAARMDRSAGRLVRMHRQLLGLRRGDGSEADHRNRNRLDNRRCNLRVVTHAENCQNMPPKGRSGFRGVRRSRGRWQAYVHAPEFRHLGVFDTPEEAAEVAAAARAELLPAAVD